MSGEFQLYRRNYLLARGIVNWKMDNIHDNYYRVIEGGTYG